MLNNNNSYNMENHQQDNDVIDLRQLLMKYLKYWYWFVLGVIIAFIFLTIYLKFTVNKYSVQSNIRLRNETSSALMSSQMATLESFGMGTTREVEDEIFVFKSRKLINKAIDELNIQCQYYKKEKLRYIELYKKTPLIVDVPKEYLDTLSKNMVLLVEKKKNFILVKSNLNKKEYKLKSIQEPFVTPLGILKLKEILPLEKKQQYKVILFTKKSLIASYQSKLKVATANGNTNVLNLSIVEANRWKGRDFLEKIVELYNEDAIYNKNTLARNTANFIKERLAIVGKQLSNAEANVEGFKRSQNLTDISSEATMFLETASEYNKKRNELEIQLSMIKSIEKTVLTPDKGNGLIPTHIISDAPTLSLTAEKYNKLVMEKMELERTASVDNPVLLQMNNRILALRENVLAGIKNYKSGVLISLRNLKRKNSEYKNKIKNIPTQERQFMNVKRQQEIKQNIYLFLLQRQEDIALQLASTEPAAQTIDRAYSLSTPVSPKRNILYLVALLLGLGIPFVIIFLIDLLNDKIEDKKEYRRLVKAPYLGSISVAKGNTDVVVGEGKTTAVVEMFRLLRTNIQFIVRSIKSPVILVTSTISGEGKSFISINLGMSLALTSKKVVLVGLDIRNPMLNEYMSITEQKGVSLYLSEHIESVDDMIVPSGHHPNFDVVPAGPIPPNPAELIMTDRLEKLFDELKQKYDYIIVDTAPIGLVTDTYLLDRVSDMALYVSRKGYTPKEATNLINEIQENKQLKNLSVVLNGTRESTEYGYTYGYKRNNSRKKKFRESFADKLNDFYRSLFTK